MVFAGSLGRLEELVNSKLDTYQPLGAPFKLDGGLCQAMVKLQDENLTEQNILRK